MSDVSQAYQNEIINIRWEEDVVWRVLLDVTWNRHSWNMLGYDSKLFIRASDLPGPAWPKSPGFGLARDGFGFLDVWAKPKPPHTAWLWPGLAQATALGRVCVVFLGATWRKIIRTFAGSRLWSSELTQGFRKFLTNKSRESHIWKNRDWPAGRHRVTSHLLFFGTTSTWRRVSEREFMCAFPSSTCPTHHPPSSFHTRSSSIGAWYILYREGFLASRWTKKLIDYCTILLNSSVTRHGPSKIDEMSRLSRWFLESDETVLRFEKSFVKLPQKNLSLPTISLKKSTTLTNFFPCHAQLSSMTKPYFCQVHHTSQHLTNWIKWYSIVGWDIGDWRHPSSSTCQKSSGTTTIEQCPLRNRCASAAHTPWFGTKGTATHWLTIDTFSSQLTHLPDLRHTVKNCDTPSPLGIGFWLGFG
jgi:hypothetical protein